MAIRDSFVVGELQFGDLLVIAGRTRTAPFCVWSFNHHSKITNQQRITNLYSQITTW